ncbi:MAG: hemolysin XhlA family protein [Crocosphaera sp.]
MNEPATVTYSITEVLKRIEDKIDNNQKETNIKLEKLNAIEVKLAKIEIEVQNLNKDVTELKGSTKAQIWTLIGILVTAVSGFFVAVARFVFYPLS